MTSNSVSFNDETSEVIRIDAQGFHYRGQFVEDAGEAHRLLVEFLRQHQPNRQWRYAAEPQPEPPTNAEIHALADELLDGDSASRVDFARAVLARWCSDGPAVQSREPASVHSKLGDN